jgi:hypothetical protein
MSDFLNVEVDPDLICEFLEDLEFSFQLVESHIIALEKEQFDISRLETLKHIFEELSLNSVKLHLLPLSEILDSAILVYERFIHWQFFSPASAELILLHMDRILHITKEIEKSLVIDLTETQHVLLSFQKISEIKQADECEMAIDDALKAITQHISTNTIQSEVDDLLDLFINDNSSQDLSVKSDADKESSKSDNNGISIEGTEVFVPKTLDQPVLHAKEIISSIRQDLSIALLSDISEMNNPDANYPNLFLLEIALAINYMAGEPINPEGLAKGICIRDIALVNNTVDIHQSGKLNKEEFQLLKQHPIISAKLAQDLQLHEDAFYAIKHHHERMDGSGYPYNLKNDEISDAGKLTAIVDSFNAMIDIRPHKKFSRSALRAVAEINACIDSDYDKFWIKQFNLFMRHHWLPIQISQNHTHNTHNTQSKPLQTNNSILFKAS